MVAIVRTEWDGTSGGPGLTQFALLGTATIDSQVAQAAVTATRKFWDAIKVYLPDECRLTVMPTVDVYNDANGELIASHVAPVPPVVLVGTGTSGYAGGAGIKVNWNTGVIRNGRRVRGATFIVPATLAAFTNTGQCAPAAQLIVNNAAQALISDVLAAGSIFSVWSRPLVKDKVQVRDGALSAVTSGTCGAKSAIQRGRRD